MAKDKTEVTTKTEATATKAAKEPDTSKDKELLVEAFTHLWVVYHKNLKPCPTRFAIGKLIDKLRVRLGDEGEAMERNWR